MAQDVGQAGANGTAAIRARYARGLPLLPSNVYIVTDNEQIARDVHSLLDNCDALAARVEALKSELSSGTVGTLTAELAQAVQANEQLAAQVAALTSERDEQERATLSCVDALKVAAEQVEALTAERAALKLALRRLLGNIATGYPRHNGYSIYYDGHFPQDMVDWVSDILNAATTPAPADAGQEG